MQFEKACQEPSQVGSGERPTPLVSCLLLTADRPEFTVNAIQCFREQTYPFASRRLQIWDNGTRPLNEFALRLRSNEFLHRAGGPTIGQLRNIGNAEDSWSDVIAHWDSDDYSAPGRLASQVSKLQTSGKALVGYHTMKFTDGQSWWQYRGNAGIGLGTSLCYRRDWWKDHPFPSQQIGEDSSFVSAAANAQQYAGEGDQDLMYATVHPGNTSPRSIILTPDGLWVELPGFQWQEAA